MIHTEATTLPAGLLKKLHVDQHVIKANLKNDEDNPPLTVQYKGEPYKAHEVEWDGPSKLVYTEPLSCGARVYIVTNAEVKLSLRDNDLTDLVDKLLEAV